MAPSTQTGSHLPPPTSPVRSLTRNKPPTCPRLQTAWARAHVCQPPLICRPRAPWARAHVCQPLLACRPHATWVLLASGPLNDQLSARGSENRAEGQRGARKVPASPRPQPVPGARSRPAAAAARARAQWHLRRRAVGRGRPLPSQVAPQVSDGARSPRGARSLPGGRGSASLGGAQRRGHTWSRQGRKSSRGRPPGPAP